jgi:hypothetical protein
MEIFKICTRCRENKNISNFTFDKTSGGSAHCRSCQKETRSIRYGITAERRKLTDAGGKICSECQDFVPISGYHRDKSTLDMCKDECKKCIADKFIVPPDSVLATCYHCSNIIPLNTCFRNSKTQTGYGNVCKNCSNTLAIEARKRRIERREPNTVDDKICRTCGLTLLPSNFYSNNNTKDGLSLYCKKCWNNSQQKKRKNEKNRKRSRKTAMLSSAKERAKKRGYPFDISPSDIIIPDICPVLGIPLFVSEGKQSHNSPSLDKIIPEKGYVRGNIAIISSRANMLKNDATFEEIEKLYFWMKNLLSPNDPTI